MAGKCSDTLTDGQLLFHLQDFYGAGQDAMEINDHEYAQECTDVVSIIREVIASRKALEAAKAAQQTALEYTAGIEDRLEDALARIAELESRTFNPALLDVIAERQRQRSVEGWTSEHDDGYSNGELAMAAICYINETGTVNRNGGKPWGWPWDASWWKPDARRRNLVKACALVLAEIERIDRAAGTAKGE